MTPADLTPEEWRRVLDAARVVAEDVRAATERVPVAMALVVTLREAARLALALVAAKGEGDAEAAATLGLREAFAQERERLAPAAKA